MITYQYVMKLTNQSWTESALKLRDYQKLVRKEQYIAEVTAYNRKKFNSYVNNKELP